MTVGPVPTTWYPEQQKLTAAGHVKGRVTASSAQCASLLFQVQVVMTWAFMTVPDLQGRPDLTTYCTTSLPKKHHEQRRLPVGLCRPQRIPTSLTRPRILI